MANCPNVNMPDWGDLINKFGEDGAYYVYMKNGDKIPYLQGEESNRFIWDVENKLGLVSWKSDNGFNKKLYKGFSQSETGKLVEQIRSEYAGKFNIKYVAPDTKGDYGMKISGYPLLRSEVEDFAMETNKDFEDAERNFKLYKEFREREREANEDIIPPAYYNQIEILYNNDRNNFDERERFNEQQIYELETVLKKAFPKVEDIIFDRKLEVKGRIKGNTIRVNPDIMTKDTIGHEFAHLLIDLRGGINDPFIQRAITLLDGTERAKKIREAYKEESEEVQQKEILAYAIGQEVVDIFETEAQMSEWEKWLNRFFRWLGARLGISKSMVRELAADMLKGRPIDSSKYTGVQRAYSQVSLGDILDIEDETIETVTDEEAQFKKTKSEERVQDEYAKIRRKASKVIDSRIAKARNSGRVEEIEGLANLLEKLQDEQNRDKNAVLQFARNSIEYINREYALYNSKVEEEKTNPEAFQIQDLLRWHDVMISYDVLDDVLSILTDPNFLGVDAQLEGKILYRIKRQLQEVVARKNDLKAQYTKIGERILADKLTPLSNTLMIETRDAKEAEWRSNNKDTTLSKKDQIKAQKEYADAYLKRNIDELRAETHALLMEQMDTANTDVSLLTRWLDTMLDTNDVVMGAITRSIVLQNSKAHKNAVEFKERIWAATKELYKQSGYEYGKTDISKVYDFMLEKNDKGEYTGYIISEVKSDLDQAYSKVKQEHAHLDGEDAKKLNSKWLKDNMPLDKKEFDQGLNDYLNDLVKDGMIQPEDVTRYWEYDKFYANSPLRSKPLLYHSLDPRSVDGASLIERWISRNTSTSSKYRKPIEKWRNHEYDKLSKFIESNPNDPKAKFYNLIIGMISDTESKLPQEKHKNYQLPFILKSTMERKTQGQKLTDLAKDRLKTMTQHRIDDTTRGQLMDENDRPVEYLPWYFNRPSATHEHEVSYRLKVSEAKGTRAKARGKAEKFKTYTKIVQADTADEAIQKVKDTIPNIDNDSIKIKHTKSIEWKSDDQSYDLASVYYNYFKMADRYNLMRQILPEVELTKRIVEGREYKRRDANGNIISKIIGEDSKRDTTKQGVEANLVKMFQDFVSNTVYSNQKVDEGTFDIMGWKFDKAKMLDNLGKYSSYTMLGLNAVQAVANVSLGELQQTIESVAGNYITTKDLHKATIEYGKEMPNILGDIGATIPTSKVNKLMEQWNILNEYDDTDFKKNTRFANLMNSSALFFMSHAGEHFMQGRIMMAMMMKHKAYDSKGNELGSIYDMYKVNKDGQLELDKRVDLEKSDWTDDRMHFFGAKVKRLLAKLHGEYSEEGKNAAQRHSIGRMGMMFRKFIVPGIKRRWQKKQVNVFLEDYTEGNYRQMFNFLWRAKREARALGFATLSENWKELSPREQADIIRGVSELGIGVLIAMLAGAFLTLKGESDDDDLRHTYALAGYLALRVKSEMFFFVKPDEALTIIKSPAVATSVIENVIKLTGQLFHPLDKYERGSWKDNPKILKTISSLTPLVKQYYKYKNIEDSLTFFVK